jgi:hypothetical protein
VDLLVWQSKQLQLDWNGDPLLNLFRGETRRLHDHLDLDWRDIGKSVDWEARQHHQSGADQQKHAKRDEQPLGKRKCDKALEHD